MSGGIVTLFSSTLLITFSMVLYSFFPVGFAQSNDPFMLPYGTAKPFFVTTNDPASTSTSTKIQPSASASSTCSGTSLSDKFDSRYYLGEGQTSPNGKWKNVYS